MTPSSVSTLSLAGETRPILLRFAFLLGIHQLEANNTLCERDSGDVADQ